ncbi:hypothetical protein BURMUCF1_A1064 [Burkholderia multivorans ATCC BAA-247]|nr:hypothetical protein BURMUCF1_A1064 [Burkholderia multivorans ATCC BAA-247]
MWRGTGIGHGGHPVAGATKRDAAPAAHRAPDPDAACIECTPVSGLQKGACSKIELTNCKVFDE